MTLDITYIKFTSALRSKLNNWQVLFYSLLLNIILGELYPLFFKGTNPIFEVGYSKVKIFAIAVFVSPIIETLFFQTFLINLFLRITKSILISVIVSAILFGLAHDYSLAYISKTMFSGFLYGNLYIICENKRSGTFYVMLFHALYNLTMLAL